MVGVAGASWERGGRTERTEPTETVVTMTENAGRSSPGFDFAWVPVGRGRLALWHRPKLRAIPYLANAGCDRIVTLLSEREGAPDIGAAVKKAGLTWSWVPLASGRPPEGHLDRTAREGVRAIVVRLEAGESVLLHCSAGIHRTGMFAYALLRCAGFGEGASLRRIAELRAHTRGGLRKAHLTWGDAMAAESAGRQGSTAGVSGGERRP